eukprot:6458356-Amphidinium_carterae.4
MEASETDSQAPKGKDRSRSNSRGKSDKSKSSHAKDPTMFGMKAAIASICVLGQQLEAIQASSAPPPASSQTGKGDAKGKTSELPEQNGDTPNAGKDLSKGTGGQDKPKGTPHTIPLSRLEPKASSFAPRSPPVDYRPFGRALRPLPSFSLRRSEVHLENTAEVVTD